MPAVQPELVNSRCADATGPWPGECPGVAGGAGKFLEKNRGQTVVRGYGGAQMPAKPAAGVVGTRVAEVTAPAGKRRHSRRLERL